MKTEADKSLEKKFAQALWRTEWDGGEEKINSEAAKEACKTTQNDYFKRARAAIGQLKRMGVKMEVSSE